MEVEGEEKKKNKNPYLGTSEYDYAYETWRCCRCDKPVALFYETERCFLERELREWERANPRRRLSCEEMERLRSKIHEQESGLRLSPRQVIHNHCLSELDETESATIRAKRDFELPLSDTYVWFGMERVNPHRVFYCAYCRGVVDRKYDRGFGYHRADAATDTPLQYLHFRCFASQMRLQTSRQRTSFDPNAVPSAYMPERHDPLSLRKKTLEWADYLARFETDVQSRRDYMAWRESVKRARDKWTPEEKQVWEGYDPTVPERIEAEKNYDVAEVRESELKQAREEREKYSYPLDAERKREAMTMLNMMEIRAASVEAEAAPK